MWFRLLVALTHLRQGLSCRGAARIFSVHERTVRKYRDEIVVLRRAHGCQPPRASTPIRTLEDLRVYLDRSAAECCMVDGTHVPRAHARRLRRAAGRVLGKDRDHVAKGTVVADYRRRPLWFEANPSEEGRTHDITMLRAQVALLAVLAATTATRGGRQGLRRAQGRHRSRPVPDSLGQAPRRRRSLTRTATRNHLLSSLRMPVEHAIGRMKWWRALRYWRNDMTRFGPTGKAVAALASIT